ncbi:hypothetical protein C9374_010242 [Naegleria lovaniensis]|uniref:RING-type domain-containing protein n=1 Tax=Naegleria lovaniensis TaxID=51637 RepID=A0AA88KEB2_NAELO|nr:uncharacterized protein C9374_010242 [Naegleria lovaniensis]KAG2374868.1 hypothetical protein C9374_010242 [Naegleria lovaniensis]
MDHALTRDDTTMANDLVHSMSMLCNHQNIGSKTIQQEQALSDVQFNFSATIKDHIFVDINSDCGICLLPLYDDTPVYKLEKCDHVFHLTCVYRCLESRNIPNNCVKCYSSISREEEKKVKLIYKDEVRSRRLAKRASNNRHTEDSKTNHEIQNATEDSKATTIVATERKVSFSLPHVINDKLTITNYGYFLNFDTRYPVHYKCTSWLHESYQFYCEIESNPSYQQEGDAVYVFKARCDDPPIDVEAFTQSELSKKIEQHLPHSTNNRRKKTVVNVSQLFGLQNRKVKAVLEQLRQVPSHEACHDQEVFEATRVVVRSAATTQEHCLDSSLEHNHIDKSDHDNIRATVGHQHPQTLQVLENHSTLKRKQMCEEEDHRLSLVRLDTTTTTCQDSLKKKRKMYLFEPGRTLFSENFSSAFMTSMNHCIITTSFNQFTDISFKHWSEQISTITTTHKDILTLVKNFLIDQYHLTSSPIFVNSPRYQSIQSLESISERDFKTIANIYMYTCHFNEFQSIINNDYCTLYDIFMCSESSMSLHCVMQVYELFCTLSQQNAALQSDIIYSCLKTQIEHDESMDLLSMVNVFYKIFQRKLYSNEELVHACRSIVSWSCKFFRPSHPVVASWDNHSTLSHVQSNSTTPCCNQEPSFCMNSMTTATTFDGREITACEKHVLYGLYILAKSIDYFIMKNLNTQTILLNLSVIIQHAQHVVDLKEIGQVIRSCCIELSPNQTIHHDTNENLNRLRVETMKELVTPSHSIRPDIETHLRSEILPSSNSQPSHVQSSNSQPSIIQSSNFQPSNVQSSNSQSSRKVSMPHEETSLNSKHSKTHNLTTCRNQNNSDHSPHSLFNSKPSSSNYTKTKYRVVTTQSNMTSPLDTSDHADTKPLLIENNHSSQERFSGTTSHLKSIQFMNHETSQLTSLSSVFSQATKSHHLDHMDFSHGEQNGDFIVNSNAQNNRMEEGEDEIASFHFSSSSGSLISELKGNVRMNPTIVFQYFHILSEYHHNVMRI